MPHFLKINRCSFLLPFLISILADHRLRFITKKGRFAPDYVPGEIAAVWGGGHLAGRTGPSPGLNQYPGNRKGVANRVLNFKRESQTGEFYGIWPVC